MCEIIERGEKETIMVADLSQFIAEKIRIILDERIDLSNNVEYSLIYRLAYKNGEIVPLTRTETKILELLALNVGSVVTYDTIIIGVWGFGDKEIVKVNISNLRRKLGIDIQSVKGIGYTITQRPCS